MSDEPDLAFDIDALFDHMTSNLDHDLQDEMEWTFTIRSNDFDALQEAAREFEDEFAIHLYEQVEELDAEGNVSLGGPLMCVLRQDALNADEVKSIAARVGAVAAARGLKYEGVGCYDPIDEQELLGWLAPEDGVWRLRHMTDCGLEPDAELPWTILVVAPDVAATDKIAADLSASEFNDFDQFDERDEDGECGVCLFIAGRNNEDQLGEAMTKIAQIAERHGGSLDSIQFYTREEFLQVFADDDEADEE